MSCRPRLSRFGYCDQVMTAPIMFRSFQPRIPTPLHSVNVIFTPVQEPYASPKIVPMEIGQYPSNQKVVPGTILANATGIIPIGYLVCNGSEVSRTTYAELFTLIGTYYGDGDFNTTFNLPNVSNTAYPNIVYIIKYDMSGGEY